MTKTTDIENFDGKMMDARDYIHNHNGRPAIELPARKVRPFLRALENRKMIAYVDGAWYCRCASCVKAGR